MECRQLSSPPAGLPPSLEVLCLGPFKEGSSHVVDISQMSQLRVLKLNCVECTELPCLQQLQQLEMRLDGDNRELPVPLTFLPRLCSLLIEALGSFSLPENMAAALPELRQMELLSWSQEELPGSIMGLTKLTSLRINAPHLVALPQGMSRLSRFVESNLAESCSWRSGRAPSGRSSR
ncbi:unnamed protein product [Closterium sp. Yama58-4]|nr:unnamed protein product [Closterium sp. Yama58-4]